MTRRRAAAAALGRPATGQRAPGRALPGSAPATSATWRHQGGCLQSRTPRHAGLPSPQSAARWRCWTPPTAPASGGLCWSARRAGEEDGGGAGQRGRRAAKCLPVAAAHPRYRWRQVCVATCLFWLRCDARSLTPSARRFLNAAPGRRAEACAYRQLAPPPAALVPSPRAEPCAANNTLIAPHGRPTR